MSWTLLPTVGLKSEKMSAEKSETKGESNAKGEFKANCENKPAEYKKLQEAFPCIECNFIGKSRKHLHAHIRTNHTLNCCKICGKFYDCQRDLNRHNQQEHPAVKFHCKSCDIFYKTKRIFEQHMKIHQEISTPRNHQSDISKNGDANMTFEYMDLGCVDDSQSRNGATENGYIYGISNVNLRNQFTSVGMGKISTNPKEVETFENENADIVRLGLHVDGGSVDLSKRGEYDLLGEKVSEALNRFELESNVVGKTGREMIFEANNSGLDPANSSTLRDPVLKGDTMFGSEITDVDDKKNRFKSVQSMKIEVIKKTKVHSDLNWKRSGQNKHKPVGESFPCAVCHYVGRSEKHLKVHHIRCHSARFTCSECGKCYGYNKDLNRHMHVHLDKMYHCQTCDKFYKTKSVYERHIDNHKDNGMKDFYKCDICNKSFGSRVAIVNHIKTVHVGRNDDSYFCLACDKTFANKWTFLQHCKKHEAIKPFRCLICSKCFTTKDSLKYHTAMHDGTSNLKTCKFCGTGFANTNRLKSHIQNCHPDEFEKNNPFQCESCFKRFKRNETLIRHMQAHVKTLTHSCDSCSKTYKNKSSLIIHQRLHTGIKPYVCYFCDLSSHEPSVLRRHVIHMHNIDAKRWREAVLINEQKTYN